MAKIVRKNALIFGENAGALEIGKFGSLAAGSVAYSTDPDDIQGLSEYLDGWFAAIVGSNSPAIEDMNALCYLYAYQIAYVMQAGVAEYNADAIYYIGSLVNDGTGILYVSLTNANTNNALTDATNWFTPTQNGVLTPNALPSTRTLPADKSLMWPNLVIAVGQTLTVPNSASLFAVESLTVDGTLTITGTGVSRVI